MKLLYMFVYQMTKYINIHAYVLNTHISHLKHKYFGFITEEQI